MTRQVVYPRFTIASLTQVRLTSGSEGPHYDPYHYDEITVHRDGRSYTMHSGLATWIEVADVRVMDNASASEEEMFKGFEILTDASFQKWHEYWHHKREICHKCNKLTDTIELGGGYAGETMYGCNVCGSIKYDDFHISMIE